MTAEHPDQPDLAARAALGRLIGGYRATHIVGIAARLGIADRLADGPRSADELARLVRADGPTLQRLLRALVGLALLVQEPEGRFRLTAMGSCLRDDVPGSQRAPAMMAASEYIQLAWLGLEHSIRTGQAAFDHVHGVSNWQYRNEHPEDGRQFNLVMTRMSEQALPALLAAYDFSPYRRIVDVGGGRGHVLAAILEANPGARGVLFDQPSVIEDARPYLEDRGVIGRCELVGGSFFDRIPVGGDLYVLKHVLNSFDDGPSGALLSACRQAMDAGATLLLIERVVPSRPDAPAEALSDGALMDLQMLVMQAGRERTEDEFRALLGPAGFALRRVIPTAGPVSIVAADPL